MATQDTILSVLATLLQMPLPFSLRDDAEALRSLAERYADQRTKLPDSQHYRLLTLPQMTMFLLRFGCCRRLRIHMRGLRRSHVMRLLDEAVAVPGDDGHDAAALLVEAAKTIDNLRNGRGG